MINKSPFKIKRNDTAPIILATVYTKGGLGGWGKMDLSGVTSVNFSMADSKGELTIASQSGTTVPSCEGLIQYAWRNGDTAVAGTYRGEVEIFFTHGTNMS